MAKYKRRVVLLFFGILGLLLLGGLAAGGTFLARHLRPEWFHEVVVEREVSALLERDGALLLLESYDYQPCEPPCRAGRLWQRRGAEEELLVEDPDLVHARQTELLGSLLVVLGCPAPPGGDRCWVAVADLDAKVVRKLRASEGASGFVVHGEDVLWNDGMRIARQHLGGTPGGKADQAVTLVEGKGTEAPGLWTLAGDELLWFDGTGKLWRTPLAGGRSKPVGDEGGPPRSISLFERTLYWTADHRTEVRALSLDVSAGAEAGARTVAADVCPGAAVRNLGDKLFVECPGSAERHGELFELPGDGSAPRPRLSTEEAGSFMHLGVLGDRFVWWEEASETLHAAPVAGGEVRELLAGAVPHGMALLGGSLYVSDAGARRVVRVDW